MGMGILHSPLEYALAYAGRGWPVFPLHTAGRRGCSCGRQGCERVGKHPRTEHGSKDATTDREVIRGWWEQWPEANVGIDTERAGLVVIDLDPTHGGDESWGRLLREQGAELHSTLRIRTGGGGAHLYFLAPESPIRSSAGRLGSGIDIRATGGYVVAPPSRHASGRRYRIESEPDAQPLPLPDGLLHLLHPSQQPQSPISSSPNGSIPEGGRNDHLFRLAGSMRRAGMAEGAILSALQTENETRCRPPLEAREVEGIAAGITRYPSGSPETPWPSLHPDALHGLVGEIVAAIAPHTESDPVALLVNTLIAFGNVAGRAPHAVADGSRHATNLYAVTVARTSKGRKGTAWSRVRELFERVDGGWGRGCVASGLSSGEGLIAAVRDPVHGPDGEVRDAGVSDKRLLVVEEEFAGTLKIATRDGNTLSATLRQAWDRGELRVMTRTNPLHASGAHVSILGHVTQEELLRYLTLTEYGNGFANRFLWICARRHQLLPDGSGSPDLHHILPRLYEAVRFARDWQEPVTRDAEARERWHQVYPALSAEREGLLGAVTGRAEAQTLRLSVLYALLDRSPLVRLPHLQAALAVWQYADDSAAYIFGGKQGDSLTDKVLTLIQGAGERGMARGELSDALGRHVPSDRLDPATETLLRNGKIAVSTRPTGGRPREVFRAV